MRVLLFDWIADGHHPKYAQAVADVLASHLSVTVAGPTAMAHALSTASADFLDLGPPRPSPDLGARLEPQLREIALRERDLAHQAVAYAKPDCFFHLYADPIIQALGGKAHIGVPSAACIFKPFAHYPRVHRTRLSPRERQRALLFELKIASWRVRREARAIFTLDPDAAQLWRRRPGARSFWFPEPPLRELPARPGTAGRKGCVLFGFLEARKGVDRLARAIELLPDPPPVTLAGELRAGFDGELERYMSEMRAAGATVLREQPTDEGSALDILSHARCVILPYRKHVGMSRVLLEAAACRTPVIADGFGLLGDLVRRHGLGLAVDSDDAETLAGALLTLCGNAGARAEYVASLDRFAARFSQASFEAAIWKPVERALLRQPAVG